MNTTTADFALEQPAPSAGVTSVGVGSGALLGSVAALFVESDGCYAGRPDIDAWPVARDARLYAGPLPAKCNPAPARKRGSGLARFFA